MEATEIKVSPWRAVLPNWLVILVWWILAINVVVWGTSSLFLWAYFALS
jgi:hypothetical protein